MNKMNSEEISKLQKSILRLENTKKELIPKIKQAEFYLNTLSELKNSADVHERLKYISAELDVAVLKNSLVNTDALLLLKNDKLSKLQESNYQEKSL